MAIAVCEIFKTVVFLKAAGKKIQKNFLIDDTQANK